MRSESMSATERMECAIGLEKPDRVPIWPDVTTSAAAGLTGQKNWEAALEGFDAQQDLELRFFDEYGGWDGANPALTPEVFTSGGFKVMKPTEESPEINSSSRITPSMKTTRSSRRSAGSSSPKSISSPGSRI